MSLAVDAFLFLTGLGMMFGIIIVSAGIADYLSKKGEALRLRAEMELESQ